ncbi:MAG: group II intron reverse transcriptase/maturase [Deltaproteobacteria bacterium]|jgi:RNA-directed DNA polymerase
MSLQTPAKIRTFQRKLYLKAKAEPDFRFYLLYDKICRADILLHAYRLAKAKGGSAGVDGMSFEHVESEGVDEWLSGIRKELRAKAYSPQPVLRRMIPKPGGGQRPLGIPTIGDRVIQTAAKLVLEPIFEADLEPNAYGYRPKRSALDAIRTVHELLCKGYTDIVDADLTKYFDTIPHSELMQCVARRIVDRNMLWLIKLWLKVPVEDRDKDGRGRMSGGRKSKKGTPQGGVISPFLANLYMNRFLKYWRLKRCNEVFRAQVVSYADDFVILSRGKADEALQWTSAVMDLLGLTLNMDKTAVRDAYTGNFDFLGYTFGRIWFRKDGSWYTGASPSKASIKRLKQKVRAMLSPCEKGAWPDVRDRLNALLRGWSAYFCYGTTQIAYRAVERNVYNRVRRFLVSRHKVRSRGIHRFPSERVFGELGVLLPRPRQYAARRVP